jgi:hypothetical protein
MKIQSLSRFGGELWQQHLQQILVVGRKTRNSAAGPITH